MLAVSSLPVLSSSWSDGNRADDAESSPVGCILSARCATEACRAGYLRLRPESQRCTEALRSVVTTGSFGTDNVIQWSQIASRYPGEPARGKFFIRSHLIIIIEAKHRVYSLRNRRSAILKILCPLKGAVFIPAASRDVSRNVGSVAPQPY